ncbi:hypothetical protein VNO80_16429 [Phaseolus coccineus]|uniref:Uncharacterized protein n=1 Tax=Phaseolus coccineus TaxID=3886 RepID=A0AAN9MNI6_PHACN
MGSYPLEEIYCTIIILAIIFFCSYDTQYREFARRTSNRSGPTHILLRKLINPNHTTGEASTPARRGIALRVGMRSVSVGAQAIIGRNFPNGSFGYQDMTILKIKRKPNTKRKGPRNPVANFTVAGSRSAIINLVIRSLETCEVSGMLSLRVFKSRSELRDICVVAASNSDDIAMPADSTTSV